MNLHQPYWHEVCDFYILLAFDYTYPEIFYVLTRSLATLAVWCKRFWINFRNKFLRDAAGERRSHDLDFTVDLKPANIEYSIVRPQFCHKSTDIQICDKFYW